MTDARHTIYLPLVAAIARSMARRNRMLDVDDAIQDGWIGLHDATRTFREGGTTFVAHARSRIAGAIYDGIRSRSWSTNRQLRKGASVRIFDVKPFEADPRSDIAQRVADARLDVLTMLSNLPEWAAAIVAARAIDERSPADVASASRRTVSAVSNDYQRAIKALRTKYGTNLTTRRTNP